MAVVRLIASSTCVSEQWQEYDRSLRLARQATPLARARAFQDRSGDDGLSPAGLTHARALGRDRESPARWCKQAAFGALLCEPRLAGPTAVFSGRRPMRVWRRDL